MVFVCFLVPSQRFIGSLLVFLVPISVFVLSQLPRVILFLKSLKTFVLCVSFYWFQELILLIPGAKAREVIKSRLLGLILSASGAKARKSLNGDFWD